MPPETRQAFAITTATALGILAWWWFRWRPRSPRASKEPDTIEMLPARATRVEQAAAVAPETPEGPGLHARLPDGRVSEYRLPAQAPYSLTVGRSGDVVIDHPSLSREHVRIEGDEQGLWVSDLVSTNGTLLGRVPCLPGEVMRWSPGITLLLGEVAVHIVDGSGES
jgi:pSer/pThr/pTyr-binding forkhead associated (FHA) protein